MNFAYFNIILTESALVIKVMGVEFKKSFQHSNSNLGMFHRHLALTSETTKLSACVERFQAVLFGNGSFSLPALIVRNLGNNESNV